MPFLWLHKNYLTTLFYHKLNCTISCFTWWAQSHILHMYVHTTFYICNMDTSGLPVRYTRSQRATGPRAKGEHIRWIISRLMVVSRKAKEKAASSALTDSRLTHVSIYRNESYENQKCHNEGALNASIFLPQIIINHSMYWGYISKVKVRRVSHC